MSDPVAAGRYCRNCDLHLGDRTANFCPHCGQDTRPYPLTPRQFLAQSLAVEGRIAKTLGLLLFRPGELTVQYIAGRRMRYVPPLRLYFAASLIFFIVVKLFGAGSLVKDDPVRAESAGPGAAAQGGSGGVKVGPAGTPVKVTGLQKEDRERPFLDVIQCDPMPTQCTKIKAHLAEKYGRQSMAEVGRQVRDKVISLAPNALFLLLPLFALMTKVLYFERRMPYGEHLVYALHVHAFTFFLLLLVAVASESVSPWLMWGGALYYWLAMRRVFRGRWWATALRYVLIGTLYPILLSLAIVATLVFAVFF